MESKFPTSAFKKEQFDAYLQTISKTVKENAKEVRNIEVTNSDASVLEMLSQPQEKDTRSCQHLPTETWTFCCQKNNPKMSNAPELGIFDINKKHQEANDDLRKNIDQNASSKESSL